MHGPLTAHVHQIVSRKTARTTTAAPPGLYRRTSVDASVAILSFATAMQCTALRARACALKLRTRPSASCSAAALLPAPPKTRVRLSIVSRCLSSSGWRVLPATSLASPQRCPTGRSHVRPSPLSVFVNDRTPRWRCERWRFARALAVIQSPRRTGWRHHMGQPVASTTRSGMPSHLSADGANA